jgi:deoxycytidylate deaminase
MASSEVSPDRVISTEERDNTLIKKASELAAKSSDWWRRIGALIVKNGEVVLEAFNSHMPSDFNLDSAGDPRTSFNPGERIDLSTAIHAEAKAISQAARKGIALEGATVYVSTFPCPGCAKLIAESGIKKVYYDQGYSLLDAENLLKDFGVEIIKVETGEKE